MATTNPIVNLDAVSTSIDRIEVNDLVYVGDSGLLCVREISPPTAVISVYTVRLHGIDINDESSHRTVSVPVGGSLDLSRAGRVEKLKKS